MTYAELFAKEYLGSIFYYCLRKTGNEAEAEELASDISLSVVQALAGGAVPERFSAWVWKIARNRYARWAEAKHRRRELFSEEDAAEHEEISDDADSPEDALVRRETIATLRRELAFIRSDYRHVLVAFYIDDKSLPQIAAERNLPLGTVKTRLFKARKILKEGMEMAREFGKLAYRPEQVSFANNVEVRGKNGEPWSLHRKLLPKNILLAAYRNPLTAEELALEIGVALPYLEEEVAELEKQLLLRKNGDKYETTVYIRSAEAQRRIYDTISAVAPAMTKAIENYIALRIALYEKNELRWNRGAQSEEDMRWALLMWVNDYAFRDVAELRGEYTSRPGGAKWDIMGNEEYDGPYHPIVGAHGCWGDPDFCQYKFTYPAGLFSKTPEHLADNLAAALKAVCLGEKADAAAIAELVRMGYLKEENGAYVPQMMVVDKRYGAIGSEGLPVEDANKLDEAWREVTACAKEAQTRCTEITRAEMPSYLQTAPELVGALRMALNFRFDMRGAVLMRALADGYISYAENDPRVMLGTYIEVDLK